jgi:class 3 adenylate cyclase
VPDQELATRSSDAIIADDRIHEVLNLAARLRSEAGGVLDDAAIEAVAEATGAPAEYVRIAVRTLDTPKRQSLLEKLRTQVSTIDSRLRSSVAVGGLSLAAGVAWSTSSLIAVGGQFAASVGALLVVAAFVAAWSSRDRQASGVLGAVWGCLHFFSYQAVATIAALIPGVGTHEKPWILLFLYLIGGFAVGVLGWDVFRQIKKSLGFRDASEERQALVSQLMEIQDRLKQDDKTAAFLSLDIVGSTRMKSENDPLSIEYTFGEYHRYIEQIALRHGGRIHSTAGDGVICVFDEPGHGFDAGRAILAGLFEFNAFRNRTQTPIVLRAGLHNGQVGAPGMDAARVDFAHVIDMAAHLQKEAEPGTMAVSEAAAAQIPGGLGGVGDSRLTVDGLQAALWRPRTTSLPLPGGRLS